MIGTGIDFGTSNSAAAWFDGETVHLVEIEPGRHYMPTAIHIDRSYVSLTGSEAIEQYVRENRARRVEMTAQPIGEAASDVREALDEPEMEGGDGRRMIYGPVEDHGLPGRLFLGLKRLLGRSDIDRITVFQRPFRLVALITPILLSLHTAVAAATMKRNQRVCLGRPVEFEGREADRNRVAVERLREANRHAGHKTVRFYHEPAAACLSFLHQHRIDRECRVLTVDFGGGTLDLSLVHWKDSDFTILGTAGEAIGGDHIDQAIYRELIFPELGKGLEWTRRAEDRTITTGFPFHRYEHALLNWTITHTLNRNEYTAPLAEYIDQGGPGTEKIGRLLDLIRHNESHNVIQAIKAAKIRLSQEREAVVDIPEINLSLTLTRERFEEIITDVLDVLREQVRQLLEHHGLDAVDVDYVVRTGGSSQIPAVIDALEEAFPGRVVEHDAFTGVAAGLAIASYHGYPGAED